MAASPSSRLAATALATGSDSPARGAMRGGSREGGEIAAFGDVLTGLGMRGFVGLGMSGFVGVVLVFVGERRAEAIRSAIVQVE